MLEIAPSDGKGRLENAMDMNTKEIHPKPSHLYIMICLVLKSGRTLAPPDLMRFCEKRMAYFMVPRYVRIMSQLPKTATERVKKSELRAAGITPETWDRDAAGYKIKR